MSKQKIKIDGKEIDPEGIAVFAGCATLILGAILFGGIGLIVGAILFDFGRGLLIGCGTACVSLFPSFIVGCRWGAKSVKKKLKQQAKEESENPASDSESDE